jgi:hypothetical protein
MGKLTYAHQTRLVLRRVAQSLISDRALTSLRRFLPLLNVRGLSPPI